MTKYFSPQSDTWALVEREGEITLYEGEAQNLKTFHDLQKVHEKYSHVVFVVPYCSIREKGYEANGDEPISVIVPQRIKTFSKDVFLSSLPDLSIQLDREVLPSISDEEFARKVQSVKDMEIEDGNAVQVVLSRYFRSRIQNFSEEKLLTLYRRLLNTRGQYMTFLFRSNDLTLIGAGPEKHLEMTDEQIIMAPIAGTMPKEKEENFIKDLETFLRDPKEKNELSQVLDEEFKMTAYLCPGGGTIKGPFLRETGAVVHTEYGLFGHRDNASPLQTLRYTMHAPTLVGGPLESAARIIAAYETESRRYYGGEIGVLKDNNLESSIVIRSAEIDESGNARIQAGAGIVRNSNPAKEADETRAKARGVLNILQDKVPELYLTPQAYRSVQALLWQRNQDLSGFHFQDQKNSRPETRFEKNKVLIINNEDNFSYVLRHMIRRMGAIASVRDTFEYKSQEADVVLLGPGPGNINNVQNPRMKRLREITGELRAEKRPLLGICLGHQALALEEGALVEKQKICSQGTQREEVVLGRKEKLGFYNSFAPRFDQDLSKELLMDVDSDGNIITMAGERYIGLQFHPESVMTRNGYEILRECLSALLQNRLPNLSNNERV